MTSEIITLKVWKSLVYDNVYFERMCITFLYDKVGIYSAGLLCVSKAKILRVSLKSRHAGNMNSIYRMSSRQTHKTS